MPPNQREVQRQLTKKYNIVFHGPIDSIAIQTWPRSCETIFQHIRQLGRTDYSEYHESVTADFSQSPWRHQVQSRAKRIAEKAKLCIEGRKNESGWRLSLEPEVMARFTEEIACRNCRGRLWRSEQEVIPSQLGGNDSTSLKARQRRRQPCKCNPGGLNQDIQEQGISPLFDDRAEEAFMYSGQLQAELPKREERPDRVFGLQATNRLSRLLQSNRDIRSSPFRSDGEPLIFPFLVIEAKSEKGSDAFTDTQVQTAFAIRELLLIQHGLAQAANENTEWDAGPLVWFLSYKGEQWRVSVAYTHDQNGVTVYRVVRLWAGTIDSLDNALQLLLIIDYIADWARDIYREGIARSLQRLAASDSSSLICDDDIFFLSGNVTDWVSNNPTASRIEANQVVEDPLCVFDSPAGVFRDARFIRSRFIGLMITEENLDQFLRTTESNLGTRRLTASLLESIEDACRVKGHSLHELEFIWTDTDRNLSEMSHPDEVFFVVVISVFYLSEEWELTRELSYVAISESLIHDLAKIAGTPLPSIQVLEQAPMVASLAAFGSLLNRVPKDNLTACISQLCLYTGPVSRNKDGRRPFVWKTLPTATAGDSRVSSRPRQQMAIKIGERCYAWFFLRDLYSKHKVGRNEPATLIFRTSSALDEVAKPQNLLRHCHLLSKDPWPWRDWVSLGESDGAEGLVFALQDGVYVCGKADLCIFVLNPSIAELGIHAKQLRNPPAHHLLVNLHDRENGGGLFWNIKVEAWGNTARLGECLRWLRRSLNRTHGSRGPSMTNWDVITTGWNKSPAARQFGFCTNRPFKRRAYQSSLKSTLLDVKISTLTIQQDVMVTANGSGKMRNSVSAMGPKAVSVPGQGSYPITDGKTNVQSQTKKNNIERRACVASSSRGKRRFPEAPHQARFILAGMMLNELKTRKGHHSQGTDIET